jgi:hypothetical protein
MKHIDWKKIGTILIGAFLVLLAEFQGQHPNGIDIPGIMLIGWPSVWTILGLAGVGRIAQVAIPDKHLPEALKTGDGTDSPPGGVPSNHE